LARLLVRVGIIKESGVLMSIFTSNEQWGKKATKHCQIPDTLYLWHQPLERNDTVLRRFPAKNIPDLLVFLSIFCVVKIVS
jgi:hypothetical protein